MQVGIIGGGNVGHGLAALLRGAGHEVTVGLRPGARPRADAPYRLATVEEAADRGEVVVVAVPFAAAAQALAPLAASLAGKVVVDATNPLNDDWSPLPLGAETSAGEEVQRLLPGAMVVKAFNTVFADVMRPDRLDRGGRRVTAFIAGDHDGANRTVEALARSAGFAPLVTGPLRNARYLEAMAHLNIAVALGGAGTDAAFLYDARPA